MKAPSMKKIKVIGNEAHFLFDRIFLMWTEWNFFTYCSHIDDVEHNEEVTNYRTKDLWDNQERGKIFPKRISKLFGNLRKFLDFLRLNLSVVALIGFF